MSETEALNVCVIVGGFALLWTRRGQAFIIDADDYDLVKRHRWFANNGYIMTNVRGPNGREKLRLATLLTGCEKPYVVDHIDNNRANNTRDNLRIVTRSENAHNRPSARGYHYCEHAKKWIARIRVQWHPLYVGAFDTEQEARVAYLKAKATVHPSTPLEYYEW